MGRFPYPLAVVAVVLSVGCAGPPFKAPIEGLPVCADFTSGNAKMEGGLKYPVRLRVLEGKNVLYQTILRGLRHADDPKPQSWFADTDAKFTVEWAQCNNPRAPRTAAEAAQTAKAREKAKESEGTGYECGEANVYKTETLDSKKGDRASHVITFVPPPNPACWEGDALPPHPVPAAFDAGVPAAPEDAGAVAVADAGAASDAGAVDAAAHPGDGGAK
jgi:hypothetical protein